MKYRFRSLSALLFLILVSAACNVDDPGPAVGGNENNSTASDADNNAQPTDMGTRPDDGNLSPGECEGLSTLNCVAPDNASVAGCVLGKCAFECEAGFADDNGDLSNPDGDGCEGTCVPTNDGVELCDGIDNDCDGSTDEDFGVNTACSVGIGACRNDGLLACDTMMSASCAATPDQPGAEICDGADNDCDGDIDESDPDVGNDCTSNEPGACAAGTWTCDAGVKTCAPNAEPTNEVCDGIDNDCDGETDEGNPGGGGSCDTGLDGICGAGVEVCDGAGGYTCDQSNTAAADEDCGTDNTGNGLDDDCDGQIDEGCSACIDGSSRDCYSGPAGTEGVGACTGGTQTCNGGQWGSCSGEVRPSQETCNGVDDNCNGATDEDFSNKGQGCTVGSGACQDSGIFVCNGSGTGTVCNGTPGSPSQETCDGIDNDCDGQVDNGVTRSCGTSTGACTTGTQACVSGAWGTCINSQGPVPERCNGIDDDCDGDTDETYSGLGTQCDVGVGQCQRTGTIVCNGAGTGTVCDAQPGAPQLEVCDGDDNDCDGQTDENITESCGSDAGSCVAGTRICNNGSFGACNGDVGPTPEACDGADNDCDGQTDEGCNCIDGMIRQCYSGPGSTAGVGKCRTGSQTCNNGSWSACSGEVTPSSETCNNVDDDCDGSVDESLSRICGSNVGACSTGTETCSGGSWGSCTGGTSPSPETCNGADDDCDGSTDEGVTTTYYFDGDTDGYGTNSSQQRCSPGGSYTATQSGDCDDTNDLINPGAMEQCFNSTDQDCDGRVACADFDCEGAGCVSGTSLGTCSGGVCQTMGTCDRTCSFGDECQECGFMDICCPQGQLCACP